MTGPVALPTADAFRAELDRQDQAAPGLPVVAATPADTGRPGSDPLPLRPRGRRAHRTVTGDKRVVPIAAQLQGSILSADTWRQAASVLRSRRTG